MKIHTCEQQTDEWFEIRKGKMSASHAQEIGNCDKGLDTYINNLMLKYCYIGKQNNFTNEDMERGNELEPQARSIYAIDKGVEIEEVGFIEYSEYIGCSPDGSVGDDGLIEIKCPNDIIYFKHLLEKEKAIESKYIWQMQMQLLITGRKWCDYVAYNPNFEKSMFIHRVFPDKEKFDKLLIGFEAGTEKIIQIKKLINN